MADQEQLDVLKLGVPAWNAWRKAHPAIRPDLGRASLPKADLRGANLNKVDFFMANLSGADLSLTSLDTALLVEANLQGAILSDANLHMAFLGGTDLRKANLSGAGLNRANLTRAILSEAYLRGASLMHANLMQANLHKAILSEADLNGANLYKADLSEANLSGAGLSTAILVETNLTDADLTGCRIHGISAWKLKVSQGTKQRDLVITAHDEPEVTVDNIEVAQFIYLLLHNEKIRDVINTITSKAVLILGRFTPPERKQVLNALRKELRAEGLLPIIFDFERPPGKTFTETIMTLAGLSRFVIIDITNPRSSPLELQATVPAFQIPFVPIIQEDEDPFSMFKDLHAAFGDAATGRMLDLLTYPSPEILVQVLKRAIIEPAQQRAEELAARKSEPLPKRDARSYLVPRAT